MKKLLLVLSAICFSGCVKKSLYIDILEENAYLKRKVFKLEKKNLLVEPCYYELRKVKQSIKVCKSEVLAKSREIDDLLDEIDFCNEQLVVEKSKNEK